MARFREFPGLGDEFEDKNSDDEYQKFDEEYEHEYDDEEYEDQYDDDNEEEYDEEYDEEQYEEVIPYSNEVIYEMDYFRPFTFLFDHPRWFSSFMLATVSHLIPVIGGVVFYGYLATLEQYFHRTKKDYSFPEFDFKHFTKYLTRGVWVFLVDFFIITIDVFLGLFVQIFMIISMPQMQGGAFPVALLLGAVAAGLLISFCIGFVSMPLMIRTGQTENFHEIFDRRWNKDFISKMWKEMLIAHFVLVIGRTILFIGGYMMFCIGILPAITMSFYVKHHMHWQLYEVYLSRGGEPISLR